MPCHVCDRPTYDRVIDKVKRGDEVEDVIIVVHKHSNMLYCD
jgi:hypothetical protein